MPANMKRSSLLGKTRLAAQATTGASRSCWWGMNDLKDMDCGGKRSGDGALGRARVDDSGGALGRSYAKAASRFACRRSPKSHQQLWDAPGEEVHRRRVLLSPRGAGDRDPSPSHPSSRYRSGCMILGLAMIEQIDQRFIACLNLGPAFRSERRGLAKTKSPGPLHRWLGENSDSIVPPLQTRDRPSAR